MWLQLGLPSRTLLLVALLLSLASHSLAKPSKETKTRAVAMEASTHDEFPEEDTDMLMEPNDFEPVTVLRSQERVFQPESTVAWTPIAQPQIAPKIAPQIAPRVDGPAAVATPGGIADSHTQAAQGFFPPFFREAPPLGHSRPYFPTPDGPAIPKYAVPLPKGDVATAAGSPPPPRGFDTSLLGSGDFGVIRGGTFYPEEEMPYHPEENSDFGDYYGDANNGHGRPANEGFIQRYTYPEEQFAHFRDFADINTPAEGAFSQFLVVYAAKNATQPGRHHPHPKNIFEQLELLDREKALEEKKKTRPSKSKAKLAKTKLQKKYKKKPSPKDLDYEPLLALS